jgi:hypothetical protein
VKGISQDLPLLHFQKLQEGFWKDIERAFRVLQACWTILTRPARFWTQEDMLGIMMTCVILHNMIVEDQQADSTNEFSLPNNIQLIPLQSKPLTSHQQQIQKVELKSSAQNQRLRKNLIDYNWA